MLFRSLRLGGRLAVAALGAGAALGPVAPVSTVPWTVPLGEAVWELQIAGLKHILANTLGVTTSSLPCTNKARFIYTAGRLRGEGCVPGVSSPSQQLRAWAGCTCNSLRTLVGSLQQTPGQSSIHDSPFFSVTKH